MLNALLTLSLTALAPQGLESQELEREAAYASLATLDRATPVVRVAEAVGPSVVYIETESTQRVSDIFWGTRNIETRSGGTGVVVHEDGYVVTNYHVIRGARDIEVSFANDPVIYSAELLSYKESEDLALLRIDSVGVLPRTVERDPLRASAFPGRSLPEHELQEVPDRRFPAVRMGTSRDLMQGERVVAIGNPHGQNHTVSTGIISGLHRDVQVSSVLAFPDLIQTDASINLGNSGGPLLNIRGELIGINTVMNVSAENIGFAIPVDRVREVLEQQLFPEARRGWLGYELRPGDDLVVERVWPGSPAAGAGICEGDRVIAVGDTKVGDQESYVHANLELEPGRPVELTLERVGEVAHARVTPWDRLDGTLFERAGFTVDEANFNGRRFVLVARVAPDSPADELGLRAGDLIPAIRPRQVGRALRIEDRLDLSGVLERLTPGSLVLFDVYRDVDRDGAYSRDELLKGEIKLR
jgi:serine protease Do